MLTTMPLPTANDFAELMIATALNAMISKRVRKSFLTNGGSVVSLLPCGSDPRDKEGTHG